MATILDEFAFRINYEVDKSGLADARQGIERLRRGWADLSRQVLTGAAALAASLAAASGATLAIVDATARAADESSRLASTLGLTVEAAQEYQAIFRRVGADSGDLSDAFATLTDRAEDAQSGMQSMADDFAVVGLSLSDLEGRDPEGLFLAFADAVSTAEDRNAALAATVRILGDDAGRKLAPLLQRGSAGIAAMRREAQALGAVMGADAVAASVRYRDATAELGLVVTALRNAIGIELMPVVTEIVEAMTDLWRANQLVIRSRIRQWTQSMEAAIRSAWSWVRQLDDAVRRWGGWERIIRGAGAALTGALGAGVLLRMVGPILQIGQGLGMIAGSLVGATAATATFVGGWVAAAVVLGALVQGVLIGGLLGALGDLNTFLEGGDSVLGRWIASLREGNEESQAWANVLESLAQVLGEANTLIAATATFVGAGFLNWISLARDGAVGLGAALRSVVDTLLDLVGMDVAGALNAIAGLIQPSAGQRRLGDAATAAAGAEFGAASQRSGLADLLGSFSSPAPSTAPGSVSSSVSVSVDARGATDPGAVGRRTGEEVDRAARQLALRTGGA